MASQRIACRNRPALAVHFARRQRGQALVYGIGLLLAGLAGLYLLFNLGQVTAEKTRLINAADAAAHAGALMQARALNYDAYSNRALVANEVLIAQMVSLSSWAQYAQQHASMLPYQFPECLDPQGYGFAIGAAFKYGPEYAAKCYLMAQYTGDAVEAVAEQIPDIAETLVDIVEASKAAILGARRLVHGSGDAAGASLFSSLRDQVIQQVADANYRGDGPVKASVKPGSDGWAGFLRLYQGNERGRFADVAQEAAWSDEFVKQRNADGAAPSPPPWEWTCVAANRRNSVKRRGGTELVNYDEWKAEDTESYWEVRNTGRWFPRCGSAEQPIAWGGQAAYASAEDGDDGTASFGGSAATNPSAHAYVSSQAWARYSGLPGYLDLAPEWLRIDSPEPRLGLTVTLSRERGDLAIPEGRSVIRQAEDTPGRVSVTAYHGDFASGRMAASAAAEVFFARPPDSADNAWGERFGKPRELASLFNPYWQVRLIDARDSGGGKP
ncbi:pilus assembly protein TadG-related protein [Noviherbaspirillum pedocola]|uniref:Putative Flp pilus-assembly TadG-like N-terminal domain-containing protein n=1 Tax=Noviherbaspirillum pedocola TaxID=2801341 RepID=A0A934SW13_9BURK|nr:pilus assembly protein TadG-related protein [Noviherbaspirillum pedocola]MBK4733739.1 hypothetical protein [Noviherbaspirillum pedocola]